MLKEKTDIISLEQRALTRWIQGDDHIDIEDIDALIKEARREGFDLAISTAMEMVCNTDKAGLVLMKGYRL